MAKDKSTTVPAEGIDETKVKKIKKDKGPKAEKAEKAGGDYGLNAPGDGSGGDRFTPADHKNDLLLVTPIEMVEGMVTSASTEPTDALRATIVVLNRANPKKSEEFEDALIFGRVVVNQLRPALQNHTRVVGTFIEDIASKKPGRNAPYRLTAPSEDDITLAKAYLDTLNPLR